MVWRARWSSLAIPTWTRWCSAHTATSSGSWSKSSSRARLSNPAKAGLRKGRRGSSTSRMEPSLAPGSSPRPDVSGLAQHLRAEMSAAADPTRAAGMQAYMKSTMPYYGVTSPQVDVICKRVFAEHSLESCGEWTAAILRLWGGARYREERYAAIRLLPLKRHRECRQ